MSFPQAGNLWQDLYINNFVDLDPGAAVLTWNCGEHSYDGHNGIDVDISSFRTQALGVPVFAPLDGTVVDAHDGEFDENTSAGSQQPNYVLLDHGGGHRTVYVHLKKDSVAVTIGQVVKAGQQLGKTGSSGSSTWPHLHFTSYLNGVAFEPFAGNCRSGPSGWVNQPPLRSSTYGTSR